MAGGRGTPETSERAGGRRYIRAGRRELYGKLAEPLPEGQKPTVEPGWRLKTPDDL